MAVEMSLTRLPGTQVTRLDPHLPGAVDRVAALAPHVVMIERGSGQGDLALALLGMGIALIELDVTRKRATALTGRQLPAAGLDDLARLLEQVIPDEPR
jgi:hypothetical protein